MTATTATSVCAEFLSGLDSDVLDYIVGILEDVDNLDHEDGIEMIAGLLVSADFCDSEDQAAMKAAAILEKLKPSGTATGAGTAVVKDISRTRPHRKKNAGKSKKKAKNKPINSAVDDNADGTAGVNADGQDQMAAIPPSKLTTPMSGLSLETPIDTPTPTPAPAPTIVPVVVTQETAAETEHETPMLALQQSRLAESWEVFAGFSMPRSLRCLIRAGGSRCWKMPRVP